MAFPLDIIMRISVDFSYKIMNHYFKTSMKNLIDEHFFRIAADEHEY